MKDKIVNKTIVENDNIECIVQKNRYDDQWRYMIHSRVQEDSRAKAAIGMVEKWAMVAAEEDGEDSAGRQKLRRMTPEELAIHACAVVDALYNQFERRGWLLPIPKYADAMSMIERESGSEAQE